MAETTSDFLVDRLHKWGVTRIYGYPGDGINGIMGALRRAEERVQFVQSRHEEMSAFMACAHAKFTGEVGVCLATSGPGAIHLLNGLYDAHGDHAPVVAIVGQKSRISLGSEYQQEVDLISLFKDVARNYVQMVADPGAMRHIIDRAMRIAFAERCVTCVIVPADVQEADAVPSPPLAHGSTFSGIGYSMPDLVPAKADLQAAADVLNAGKRVAILAGAGALGATDELMEVSEVLGAGVAKALLGRAALPDDLPYVTGAIGLLGTKPSWKLMQECDTLFMVGSGFPYSEFLPEEGQARGVQIDRKSRMLSLRYPMEVNLHGDSKLTLRALLPLLKRKEDRSWQEDLGKEISEWWKVMEARSELEADPVNPQRVFWEASKRLPDKCMITADSGSAANWFARDLKLRRGMMATLSGRLATMCPGVPYAVGAKFAFPERPCIAFVGDGAMQMLGNNGLMTIAKYYKEWSNPQLVICVLNNEDLNQVTWEQRVMEGDPKFEASQDLPAFNYAAYGAQLGLHGIRVEADEDVARGWDEALAAKVPVVLDVRTDPDIPPLPPHITLSQAKGFFMSLVKGDPDTRGVVKQSFKEMVEAMMPTKSGR